MNLVDMMQEINDFNMLRKKYSFSVKTEKSKEYNRYSIKSRLYGINEYVTLEFLNDVFLKPNKKIVIESIIGYRYSTYKRHQYHIVTFKTYSEANRAMKNILLNLFKMYSNSMEEVIEKNIIIPF